MLTGIRIGIGFGWTTLVAAQMLVAAGLGHMILNASAFLMTDMVVMGIVIIGLVSLFSDLLMRYFYHKLVPWKGKM
jgi:taurine transport system permease protein